MVKILLSTGGSIRPFTIYWREHKPADEDCIILMVTHTSSMLLKIVYHIHFVY